LVQGLKWCKNSCDYFGLFWATFRVDRNWQIAHCSTDSLSLKIEAVVHVDGGKNKQSFRTDP
jgi:hypothetical protein